MLVFSVLSLIINACGTVSSKTSQQQNVPEYSPVIRVIRAYGEGNEELPPVVLIDKSTSNTPLQQNTIGSDAVTVEFDVQSSSIPNVYVRLVHCNAMWQPDNNGFLNDVTNRTSIIDWTLAPQRSTWYQYRGTITLPNAQTQFRFSGNWLAQVVLMDTDEVLGEVQLFVVKTRAAITMNMLTDFYEPKHRVSSTAYTIESIVRGSPGEVLNNFLHTVVVYRNNRWNQPFTISETYETTTMPPWISTATSGISAAGKLFRVSRIPAENEYRIVDVSNLALFPSTGAPVQLPFSDLRRNGQFLQRAHDGAMITRGISQSNDEYVPVEFMLDPAPGGPSLDDVFVVGSMNQWKASREWVMHWNPEQRLYRVRGWVRRGTHNYMYGTGTLQSATEEMPNPSFEEFEGNTASANNSFLSFAYYKELDYGGYDGLIAVTGTTIYQSGR
jgi:hypothetical protein